MEIVIDEKFALNKNIKGIIGNDQQSVVHNIDPIIIYLFTNDILMWVYLPFFKLVTHFRGAETDVTSYLKQLDSKKFLSIFTEFGEFTVEKIPQFKSHVETLIYESDAQYFKNIGKIDFCHCIGLLNFLSVDKDAYKNKLADKYKNNDDFSNLLYWISDRLVDDTFIMLLDKCCHTITMGILKDSTNIIKLIDNISYVEYLQHHLLRNEIAEITAYYMETNKKHNKTKYEIEKKDKEIKLIHYLLPKAITITSERSVKNASRLHFDKVTYYNKLSNEKKIK